jgi:hypothetical protein
MNVQEAIKSLELTKHTEAKLMVYIQTGPYSWEWKEVTHFVSLATSEHGVIIDVNY